MSSSSTTSSEPTTNADKNDWAHCFCLVSFEQSKGHVISYSYPSKVVLTDAEKSDICYHAFPDSTTTPGDHQFAFKINSSDKTAFFGFVYFRLLRDITADRGYEQKSLVLLVRQPFVSLYKTLLPLVANTYFDANSCATSIAALETAWKHMLVWPEPKLGFTYELPFLGSELTFHLPYANGIVSHVIDAPVPLKAPFEACTALVSNLDSVNVFTAFSSITKHLWLLWELMITGEPVLLFGSTPAHCSDGVFALLSLIAPLSYGGNTHPFFTIHDKEFNSYKTHITGAPAPAAVVGVSNPFFFRALAHWPHVITIGELDRSAAKMARTSASRPGTATVVRSSKFAQAMAPSSNRARMSSGRGYESLTCAVASSRAPTFKAPRAVLATLLTATASTAPSALVAESPVKTAARASSLPSSSSGGWWPFGWGKRRLDIRISIELDSDEKKAGDDDAGDDEATSGNDDDVDDKVADNDGDKADVNDDNAVVDDQQVDTKIGDEENETQPNNEDKKTDINNNTTTDNNNSDEQPPTDQTNTVVKQKNAAPSTSLSSNSTTAQHRPVSVPAIPARIKPLHNASEMLLSAWDAVVGATTAGNAEPEQAAVHNNAILRRHFFELTQSFLAPCESYFQTLLPSKAGAPLRPWREDAFLTHIRSKKPLRSMARSTDDIVDLYKRWHRSCNFQSWHAERTAAATAHLNEPNEK